MNCNHKYRIGENTMRTITPTIIRGVRKMINTDKILKRFEDEGNSFNTDFLQERLSYGEYSTLEDLIEYLNNGNDIHEYADSMVDIYNYDLRRWAVENYDSIEKAIDEQGAPEPFDFHEAIQYGQYYKYCQDIDEDCSELETFIDENYKV